MTLRPLMKALRVKDDGSVDREVRAAESSWFAGGSSG
jgi:hypothetical protein